MYTFDSLGYAKRLRDAGLSTDQAEAHAEAARDFIMSELVTRHDLEVTRTALEASIDRLTLRISLRMGVMLAAGIAALAALVKIT